MAMIRTGIGYDVHKLAAGRKLVLGGVTIPFELGLVGHSDGDVLIHAMADAILGALGKRDIGFFFPNSDPRWKDISSLVFLERISQMLSEENGHIENIDSVVICEKPKIAPYIEEMKEKIASSLGVDRSVVGIKATTNESLGFVGRAEGIAAFATCLVRKAE
ncbi:2C-methyl-D-erythritol 2,4-cyclodiphosphate synthase [Methylacidiphilum infernorum V4]|uniref:2-C-methyl-D-erythritol 2,4-cyclodiphosphate synthase n=2 Tax=Candidatus Methylacidiphilum infernorum TaxID=511746 RepID=B3E0S2_METI4|nr:2-C-methyl-D-erythritol 2,4-cyclodiphosphate synthase [Candidatus Methylacidiphilum infernorum]ACD82826.1 2C-methyl-D-erythritol 2,4-cyclodiphosphate synthase [Methylacidiphilum infernorum V4]